MAKTDLKPFRKPLPSAHTRPSAIAELLHHSGHSSPRTRHPGCTHLHSANWLHTRLAMKVSEFLPLPAVADPHRCCLLQAALSEHRSQPNCPYPAAEKI